MNRLAGETSPYLRQHRDNPVDWYPWGDEAFARAHAEDKPVLLSVGYSACHWCHVMAHESFEDAEVAAAMNDRFVSIKVDREERPDVDAVYMDAVQAINGHGGWPMTVFLAPDGRPFYGGTYYPKGTFLQLLAAVSEAWGDRRGDLLQQAGHLVEALDRTAQVEPAADVPGIELLNHALGQLAGNFDAEWGGFGGAPKFPQAMSLELVLRAHRSSGSAEALTVVTTSLDAMASGGMYDHLGGGFARYSVDRQWLVPHFEKMLYDQALLVPIYLHAWQVTGERRYLQVVEETVGYVLRDLGQPEGGFSSAEDADSPGPDGHNEEGRFYTWTPDEIRAVVADADPVLEWYGVTEAGNFEGRTILHRPVRADLLRPTAIDDARQRLFEARSARPRPGLDDKVLTEWNALMLCALAEAGAATGRTEWVDAARRTGEFLLASMRADDGRWHRSWQRDGGARHAALAADHAALLVAFLALASATGEARWVAEAADVADTLLDHFWDAGQGGLYTTADDAEALVVRQKDLVDSATPSANSLGAVGLARLSAVTGEPRYRNHSDQILRLGAALAAGAPSAFSYLLAAVDMRRASITEIAVAGPRPDLVAAVHERYLPDAVLAWGERFDSPLWDERRDGFAYVCHDYACEAPTDTVEGLVALLSGV
ncbi:MAG TPA: thioredoxin domain-containing protein [Acidimicrobiales bacterium]